MMNKPSSYSAYSLTTSSCHGRCFSFSSSVPGDDSHHFSQFWDLLYGLFSLGLETEAHFCSQFSHLLNLRILWCVCVELFYVLILGNQFTYLRFHQGEPRGHAPTIQHRWRETSTCLLRGQILSLHLNYVVGYTWPLLFLFKQT